MKTLQTGTPVIYRIRVSGNVDPQLSDRLAGMQITSSIPSKKSETTLVGRLQDQSALNGVLNLLYNMRLPVISVKAISVD